MTNKLLIAEKRALRKASRDAMVTNLALLSRTFRSERIIRVGNRYRIETVDRIEEDLRATRLDSRDLRDYSTISSAVHCIDGWAYFSRAIESLTRGEDNIALHLAYYAELRAAMSILSSEGIQVFDRQHFVVEQSGACVKISGRGNNTRTQRYGLGTHQWCWLAFEHWSGLARSGSALSRAISPVDIPLNEWFAAFGAGSSSSALSMKLLGRWGSDLKHFSEDRNARNISSYRPSHLEGGKGPEPLAVSNLFQSVWSLCQPAGKNGFGHFDLYLLRRSIESLYRAVTGRTAISHRIDFSARIELMLDRLDFADEQKSRITLFLTRSNSPDDPLVFSLAEKFTTHRSDPSYSLSVASRALLMLRLATGSSRALFSSAGVEVSEIDFWWRTWGQRKGFWQSEPVLPAEDLWEDIKESVSSLSDWQQHCDDQGVNPQWADWWQNDSRRLAIARATEFERVAFWSIRT